MDHVRHTHHHHHHHHSSQGHSQGHSQTHSQSHPQNHGHGGHSGHSGHSSHNHKGKNYKLLVDPAIVKGASKLYRYEGVVPGDSTYGPVTPKDPRSKLTRLWVRIETIHLPVPRFKIDGNYVGEPPSIEVTIHNLNDNIDKMFLTDMVSKFGEFEELVIFYHPVTNKHLGMSRVVFMEVSSAKECVSNLHNKSVMGKQLQVILDPFGEECKKRYADLTTEKRPPPAEQEKPTVVAEKTTDPKPEQTAEKVPEIKNHQTEEDCNYSPKYEETKDGKKKIKRNKKDKHREREKDRERDKREETINRASVTPNSSAASSDLGYGTETSFPNFSHPPPTHIPPPNHLSSALVPPPFAPSYPPPPIATAPYPPYHAPPSGFSAPPPPHQPWTAWESWTRGPLPPPQGPRWQPPQPPGFMSPPHSFPAPPAGPKPSSEDESNLDLDTRIELILKGKGPGGVQFLQLGMSDESDDGKAPKSKGKSTSPQRRRGSLPPSPSPPPLPPGEDLPPPPPSPSPSTPTDPDAPLSTPPSPFLSEEVYHYWHDLAIENILKAKLKELEETERVEKLRLESDKVSEISSSEDEEMFGEKVVPLKKSDRKKSKDSAQDDQMSLSSLSSGEEKIEEVSQSNFIPSDLYSSYTSHFPGEMFHTGAPPGAHFSQSHFVSHHHHHNNFVSFVPPPSSAPQAFHSDPYFWRGGYVPGYHSVPNVPNFPPPNGPLQTPLIPKLEEGEKEKEAPHGTTVHGVLSKVTSDLKSILKRDFNKKMIENTAFKKYEAWWDQEEQTYKAMTNMAASANSEETRVEGTKDKPQATTETLLNNIMDTNYESVGYGTGGFGLGFRAALPKLPSFRRKKMPSPVRMDGEDSHMSGSRNKDNDSDQEEMVKLSDSESQQAQDSRGDLVKRRPKAMVSSTSSSGSETSDSSSDSSSSESEEESSDEEVTEPVTSAQDLCMDDLLAAVDFDKVEELRAKTPDGRLTPVPFGLDAFSDDEGSEDLSKPPKTPDIHLSDETETSPRRRNSSKTMSAKEALITLGLADLVDEISIREDTVKLPSVVATPRKKKVRSYSPVVTPSPPRPSRVSSEREAKTPEPVWDAMEKKESKENKVPGVKGGESMEEERTNVALELTNGENASELDLEDDKSRSSPESQIQMEHSYTRRKEAYIQDDHDYAGLQAQPESPLTPELENHTMGKTWGRSSTKEIKESSEQLVSHLLDTYLKKKKKPPLKYTERDLISEMQVLYEFLTKGIGAEDIKYLKRSYEAMLADESQAYWLNDTHWVDHPVTDLSSGSPSKKTKLNSTGSARTQGFFKLDATEKIWHKLQFHKATAQQPAKRGVKGAARGIRGVSDIVRGVSQAASAASREARSNQRRLLTAYGTDTDSDLLKFNQLKFRKKQLKFSKSDIHDWGLFAMEPIAADEMVIEYVGQMVRPSLADFREKDYEKKGIGSSYLFRVDLEMIIDATKCGNLARFINHSCNPNCYAKIITIEGQKKIVIYSKKDIKVDEEITYDYKFPLEEEKIACLCGAAQCKGFLN